MPRRARDEDEDDAPDKRARRAYAKGAICRVKLHNFMSYTDAEIVDPGAQLNCIIGPNGTGKSSIVCALCVGLGGPIKITERGEKIGACVHGGGETKDANGNLITDAFVETELVDGNGPGRNLVVRLDFDSKNKEVWRLDGAVTSKKAVKAKMEELNIQVDNPLQFLPQDKVGQFSNMSPTELLKHTEMAIGPKVWEKHQLLISLDKDLHESKQRLTVEEKSLEDLNASLDALKKDVERYNAYLANLEKLRQMEGKRLWLVHNQTEEEMLSMKQEYDEKRSAFKELEQQKKKLDEQLRPLEELKRESATAQKTATKELEVKLKKKNDATLKTDELNDDIENKRLALKGVDAELRKLKAEREKQEREMAKNDEAIKVTREKIQKDFDRPIDQLHKEIKDEYGKTQAALREAEIAVDDHKREADDLAQEEERAQGELARLHDVQVQKMQQLKKMNLPATELAHEIYDRRQMTPNEAIGPLLMEIDVGNKAHRHLVEQVLNSKYLSAFIARNNAARDTLNDLSRGKPVNIYRCPPDRRFEPRQRPASKELAKFGVTAWLDEALTIKPENQSDVLNVLRDCVKVDSILLGSDKTVNCIQELQEFLASKQCENVQIITPQRMYRSNRSRYGNKALTTSTSMLKPETRSFENVVDPAVRKQREQALAHAKARAKEHGKSLARLAKAQAEKQAALDEVGQRKSLLDNSAKALRTFEGRVAALQQRVDKAREKETAFDADARKRAMRRELASAHEAVLDQTAKLIAGMAEAEAALVKAHGAQIALKAADAELESSKAESDDLSRRMEEAKTRYARLKEQCKDKARDVNAKKAAAREKAPEFEPLATPSEDGPEAGAEAAAAWAALADDAKTLEDDVDELQDETGGDTANAEAIKQYKLKEKKIEEEKERVAQTTAEVQSKQATLQATEAEWKPALEQMVETVDRSFASYFARFNCEGEVALSDGRAIGEDGRPYGEDKYQDYKIHIKVKWRASEALHVLGEAGRDSGGERSVATMVYLISLQNINPAPFRVVDEINQAMDSSNERNVFQCITHACSQGGNQYFLLTPKLLPDLDYGEETAIQFVYNGPYMVPRDEFNLARFV